MACRNPQLAKLRAHKREELLGATETAIEKIKAQAGAAKLAGQDAIGVCAGKIVSQYKVAKHFKLKIGKTTFAFRRKADSIAAEAALDGLYIIRTSVPADEMQAADCVRNYKSLADVEWHMREAWRELIFADPTRRRRRLAIPWPRGPLRRHLGQGRSPHHRRRFAGAQLCHFDG